MLCHSLTFVWVWAGQFASLILCFPLQNTRAILDKSIAKIDRMTWIKGGRWVPNERSLLSLHEPEWWTIVLLYGIKSMPASQHILFLGGGPKVVSEVCLLDLEKRVQGIGWSWRRGSCGSSSGGTLPHSVTEKCTFSSARLLQSSSLITRTFCNCSIVLYQDVCLCVNVCGCGCF